MAALHNEIVRVHFLHPRNAMSPNQADGIGTEGIPGHGPFTRIFVRLDRDRILDIGF